MRATTTIIAMMFAMAALGQTKEQVTAEIQRQCIPNPDIVLAQARLETGNFKSDRCRRDHNLFGIKHGKKYARYRTWQESVADYKARISTRYKGGDYYAFLRRIGYAKDPKYTAKLKQF
jgi:flagellum-specific peptidoglycan hydrolase FlgJ